MVAYEQILVMTDEVTLGAFDHLVDVIREVGSAEIVYPRRIKMRVEAPDLWELHEALVELQLSLNSWGLAWAPERIHNIESELSDIQGLVGRLDEIEWHQQRANYEPECPACEEFRPSHDKSCWFKRLLDMLDASRTQPNIPAVMFGYGERPGSYRCAQCQRRHLQTSKIGIAHRP